MRLALLLFQSVVQEVHRALLGVGGRFDANNNHRRNYILQHLSDRLLPESSIAKRWRDTCQLHSAHVANNDLRVLD